MAQPMAVSGVKDAGRGRTHSRQAKMATPVLLSGE